MGYFQEAFEGVSEGLDAAESMLMPYTLSRGAEKPRRGHPDDAGLDLLVSEDTWCHPGVYTDVPCGVSVALPRGTFGLITGRSSTLRNRGLLCAQGVIDEGYTGELFAGVWNLTQETVFIPKHDRVAQLIILPALVPSVVLVPAPSLAARSRGSDGFGSTGT